MEFSWDSAVSGRDWLAVIVVPLFVVSVMVADPFVKPVVGSFVVNAVVVLGLMVRSEAGMGVSVFFCESAKKKC